MAKANEITFLIIREGAGKYIANINIGKSYAGYSGIGPTPAKAKSDARRKLKKLGNVNR